MQIKWSLEGHRGRMDATQAQRRGLCGVLGHESGNGSNKRVIAQPKYYHSIASCTDQMNLTLLEKVDDVFLRMVKQVKYICWKLVDCPALSKKSCIYPKFSRVHCHLHECTSQ